MAVVTEQFIVGGLFSSIEVSNRPPALGDLSVRVPSAGKSAGFT